MRKYYNFYTGLAVVFAVGIITMSLYATRCHGESCDVENGVEIEKTTTFKMDPGITTKRVENNEIVLLDVREDWEWEEGYISGAIHIPVGEINAETVKIIAKGKPIYVYCRSGRRAEEGVAILKSLGFNDVTNLGGILQWQADGGTLIVD